MDSKIVQVNTTVHMTGYAGSRDYVRREPVVSVKNPTLIPTPAQNLQREGWSLPRHGRDHPFQWDVGIIVGFFTETTGSLSNPETRRTPSYMAVCHKFETPCPKFGHLQNLLMDCPL